MIGPIIEVHVFFHQRLNSYLRNESTTKSSKYFVSLTELDDDCERFGLHLEIRIPVEVNNMSIKKNIPSGHLKPLEITMNLTCSSDTGQSN